MFYYHKNLWIQSSQQKFDHWLGHRDSNFPASYYSWKMSQGKGHILRIRQYSNTFFYPDEFVESDHAKVVGILFEIPF